MYNVFTSVRRIIVLLVPVIGVSAVVVTSMSYRTDSTLQRLLRFDIAWSGAHGQAEAERLERAVETYALRSTPARRRDLERAYEIFRNRMDIWRSGDFGRFLEQNPEAKKRYVDLSSNVDAFDRLLALDNQNPGSELVGTADRIVDLSVRLSSQARSVVVSQAADLRARSRIEEKVQRYLIISLFALGLLLIGIMGHQNAALVRAKEAATRSSRNYAHLAGHDPLTKLPNRAGFANRLAKAHFEQHDDSGQLAILAVDLDGFKAINDSLGHAAGDRLLMSVAERMKRLVASWDRRNVVSRFGGDEFVVLLWLNGGETEAIAKAEWLRNTLRNRHEIGQSSVVVDVTIGISVETDGRDEKNLPADADLALMRAKLEGKGTVLVFEPEMRASSQRRVSLELELHEALARDEILPFYQPQVDLASGKVVGLEALARWHNPKRGWISPREFIPVAEASGQIIEIGTIILEAACRDALSLPGDIPVSVNLSVAQLMSENFPRELAGVLGRIDIPPQRVKLEVTESLMMKDPQRSLATLERIKRLGIELSLDDFGTGFSSLSLLQQFDWDQLKIDRSFVTTDTREPQSAAITRTIISLAHQLDIDVVAEGIETPYDASRLAEAGCNTGQGFYFCRPVPLEKLHLFLTKRLTTPAAPPAELFNSVRA